MARICAGPASGCNARALPLPWCRRPSSLPYSYLQRLADLLVARRCCCHPPAERRGDRGVATPNRPVLSPAPASPTGLSRWPRAASGSRPSSCPCCRPHVYVAAGVTCAAHALVTGPVSSSADHSYISSPSAASMKTSASQPLILPLIEGRSAKPLVLLRPSRSGPRST